MYGFYYFIDDFKRHFTVFCTVEIRNGRFEGKFPQTP